jgi:VanZ family protein
MHAASNVRSPAIWACLLSYVFLIVYASLYPFSGWHDLGLSPFGYFATGLPRYWTWFDLITNVFGYGPLGFLLVLMCYPQLRGTKAIVLACAGGALLSALLEATQTFLPSRVPSLLDWLTNLGGTLLGAVLGHVLVAPILLRSKLDQLRQQWLVYEAGPGLVLLGLWPLAQIYPQGYLFGHGQLLPILSGWLGNWQEQPIDLAAWLRGGEQLSVQQYWLAETIITACSFTGAVLTLLCLLRKGAPAVALMATLIGAAFLVKSLASALFFTPEHALVWLTPGAQGGCIIGLIMISGLVYARPVAQRRLAALTLLLSVIIINLIPVNPYFTATLQTWVQGKFLNFNGAAQFLSLFWPFFALWFLWHPAHSLNRK